MNGYRLSVIGKAIALAFFAGALPFTFIAPAYASETRVESGETRVESKWLDDYSQPVGLTYGAQARVQTAYLWRGLYCGAANIQASANVGYGGLYADMWWNIGVTEWSFKTFEPEVDVSLGFARWGLDVFVLYVHNFNCGFFDFNNYPDKGNRFEINARYTVSSKLPISVLWATRVAASDGYLNATGDTVRAYSSYAEISYTQKLPYDLSLYGAVGFSPWKSIYSYYQRDFVVNNVELRLRKDWTVSERCGLMLQGQVVLNPSAIAADKSSVQWKPTYPFYQSVNANIAFGVYLK